LTFVEELMQFTENGHGMRLIWMQGVVENDLHGMDGISNDNDFRNTFLVASLVNAASNSK